MSSGPTSLPPVNDRADSGGLSNNNQNARTAVGGDRTVCFTSVAAFRLAGTMAVGVVGAGPDLLGETKEKAALTKVVNARSEFLVGKNSNSAGPRRNYFTGVRN